MNYIDNNEIIKLMSDNIVSIDEAKQKELSYLRIDDFLKKELPQVEYLLSPWLPKKAVAILHAKRGVGKTFFALNVAYAIASGKSFAGWIPHGKSKVLYIDGEMRARTIQERIAEIATQFGVFDVDENFYIMSSDLQKDDNNNINLYNRSEQDQVTEICEREKIELVILDNISSLVSGIVENEAKEWEPLINFELRLKRKGISTLRIMHTGKTEKIRASSKAEDNPDTIISLKNPDDYEHSQGARFTVNFEKHRDFFGQDAKPFELKLENGKWIKLDANKSTYDQVVELYKQKFKQHEISDLLKISKGMVSKYIKQGIEEGLLV